MALSTGTKLGAYEVVAMLGANSDITSDGKRFVGVIDSGSTASAAPAAPQIQVVLNWFEELKRRVPVK